MLRLDYIIIMIQRLFRQNVEWFQIWYMRECYYSHQSHISYICHTIRNIDIGEWTTQQKSFISYILSHYSEYWYWWVNYTPKKHNLLYLSHYSEYWYWWVNYIRQKHNLLYLLHYSGYWYWWVTNTSKKHNLQYLSHYSEYWYWWVNYSSKTLHFQYLSHYSEYWYWWVNYNYRIYNRLLLNIL